MLAVEVRCGHVGDEELASVGSGAGVCHGEEAGAVMSESWCKLVCKAISRTAHAGSRGIAALNHEVGDHAVKGDPVVVAAACEIEEIGHRDGGLAGEEGGMDVALVGVHHDPDILDGFGRVCGTDDAGCHRESCGKGEKCLFHRSTIG